MVVQDLDFLFDSLDVECRGYIEWIELQDFDDSLFGKSLSIEQLEASIKTVRISLSSVNKLSDISM